MLKNKWLVATLFAACSAANANPYIGASIGQATFDNASGSMDSSLVSGSAPLELQDDSSLAGKLYAGYQFNEYFALEGSLGGYDALDGDLVTVGDMKFLAIQPKVILPVGERFNLFAKAGVSYFNAEFKASNSILGSAGYTTLSDTAFAGMYGLGAEFALTDNLHLEASWDYMNPELEVVKLADANAKVEAEISVLSLGVSYHF